ncbi:MAG: B12-binding domain-containing radical SAM protein [Pseudomonadota bacterium]
MPPLPTDRTAPHILLVNPWIHDFAAYDFWAKPLGLLSLGGILRHHGMRVSFIDCLDRFHPSGPQKENDRRQGRGPYRKVAIPKPAVLSDISRTYSRYGIPVDALRQDLARLPRPDLVLVTSLMTYWYPGVVETIREIKTAFPQVPVILGGIYATLNTAHARAHSGADRVVGGMAEDRILDLVAAVTGFRAAPRFDPADMDSWPYPVLDLQHRMTSLPLLTGRGCPFACDYCASRLLNPGWLRRSPGHVAEEIFYWQRRTGLRDVVFYDDALLVDAETHLMPVLERVIRENGNIRFHTPNALHLRFITGDIARLMKRAGFATIRLGLETMDFTAHRHLDRKVSEEAFLTAVSHLRAAGFDSGQLGAYILAGLPGQTIAEIENMIRLARRGGVTPVLAHYTPIPGTPLWQSACTASRYDLAADPVTTNNAVFPCLSDGFSWEVLTRLKRLAKGEIE